MENGSVEKKVYFLGTWRNNILADNIISQVVSLSRNKKGVKVRLSMSRDGLRVVRSTLLQGKMLTNFIPVVNLYFMTINQHNPECLLVIAKDVSQKYQILAFRCANGLDAGFFVQCFKGVRQSFQSVEGFNVELKRSNGGNWTLRDKQTADDKRQLSSFVDIRTEKTVIRQNGNVHKSPERKIIETQHKPITDENKNVSYTVVQTRVENSPPPVPKEKVFREDVYLEGKTLHSIGIQAANTSSEQYPDNVSEISDSNQSLQSELNYLSNELREIKFMLEKSTGISAEEFHEKTEKSQPKQVVVKHEISREVIETVPEPIDAVVLDGDDDEPPTENGDVFVKYDNKVEVNGEVRAVVPDYRSLGIQTVPKFVQRKSATLPAQTRESQSEDKPELLRASTSSYTNWRDDVVLRSRPSRSARPRSALYSTSSYGSTSDESLKGSIRVANGGQLHLIYGTEGNQQGSIKQKRRVSTNVQKPIERVYRRPHSMHGSVHQRPVSVHQTHGHMYKVAVPQNLDLNQNTMNGSVVLRHSVKHNNGDISPSSPRQTIVFKT